MARNSKIIIAKNIRLDKEHKEVLNYSESDMLNLVNTNKVADASNYSFIREEENTISTHFAYSDCLKCNYMAFQNPDYDNKWFFAFIDDVKYVSDAVTQITFTVDAWATWYSKLTVTSSFVIREHVSDDTVGLHTLPENLETGDYVIDGATGSNFGASHLVMSTTISVANGSAFGGILRDGMYSGLNYVLFKTYNDLNECIKQIDAWGKSDSVQAIFYVLDDLSDYNNVTWSTHSDTYTYQYAGLNNGLNYAKFIKEITISRVTSFGNFTPRNNKLYSYPFCFLDVTNNVGNNAIYHFEDFSNINSIKFNIYGVLCQGNSVFSYPLNYKNGVYDAGVLLGKLPTCSWQSDSFTNWLTQNAVNIPLQIASETLAVGSGAISGNVVTSASGLIAIAESVGAVYQHSLIPPQAHGNSNSGDVLFAIENSMNFVYNKKRIKEEYARCIDNYFSRYGYKINRDKVPNITGRRYWNYIQIASSDTLGYGEIPQKFMDEINIIARTGVTIWHDHQYIGDYTLNNTII